MHYDRDASPGTNCTWDYPAYEQITYYDATLKSVLSTSARERLALGMLELERSHSATFAWADGFQVQSEDPEQRQHSSSQCPWQGSHITARRAFSSGDFMGFALGRVMTASTADGVLAAAKTPAQLLELSGRMFRFVARPPACGDQQSSNAAAVSKQVAVLFSDKVKTNPLAHAHVPRYQRGLQPRSRSAKCRLPPLSFNITGDVYVAVTAMRDIAAGEEVTVDRGVVTYSRPMHDLVQTVLKRTETLQLREATGLIGQQQQQQQQEQDYHQPPVPLLKQQLTAALATCAQLTASSSSGNTRSSFAVLGDKLTKNLQQAVDICKQLPAAAAAAADTALPAPLEVHPEPAAAGATSRSLAAAKQRTPKLSILKALAAARQHAAGACANKAAAAVTPHQLQQGSASTCHNQVRTSPAAPSAQREQMTGLRQATAAAAADKPGASLAQAAAHTALNASSAAAGVTATQQQQKLPLAVDATGIAAAAATGAVPLVGRKRSLHSSAAAAAAEETPIRSPSVVHVGGGGIAERGYTQRQAAKRAAEALHQCYQGSEDPSSWRCKKRQQRSSSGFPPEQQLQQLESLVQDLVQRLCSDDQKTQRTAAESLGRLACSSTQHCDVIAAAGAIPLLVNLLSSNSSKCQRAAAGVLVTMTHHNAQHIQAVVATAGSMKALLQLLCGTDQNLLESVAVLLGNVLSQNEYGWHNGVITAGVVPVLTGHLRSSNSELQLAAAIPLCQLAITHPEAVGSELLHLAATLTVPLLDSKDKHIMLKAFKAALCLAELPGPGIQPLVAAVPKAVNALKSSDTTVLVHAASLLWGLGEYSNVSDVVQAEVLSQGAVPAIVKLLSSSNVEVQHNAAGTIMVLARSNESIRVQAAPAGAVGPLMQMLSNSDSNVLEDVVGALESLATGSPEVQAAIAAVPAAVEQLRELSISNGGTVAERATAVVKLLGMLGTAG